MTMQLEWQKHAPDAVGSHTKCRRYTTCRTNNEGTLWEVWKLAPGGPWFALLGKNLPNEDAAKARAEADAA